MPSNFEWQSWVSACEAQISTRLAQNMNRACIQLINKVKERLTGTRTGRTYRVPGTKKYYVASAPGETPAVRTGRLRNSIKYYVRGSGLNIEGVVGTPLDYAPHLEFGTKTMAARPFLRITYEQERLRIQAILQEGLR